MNEFNDRNLTDPTVGEFAPTWELIGKLPTPKPAAGFADRLTAALRAEMAAQALARRRSAPARGRSRVWAVVAAAAALAAAAWIGLGLFNRPAEDTGSREVAEIKPAPSPSGAPDLAAVESVPADVVAAVDGLAEIRIETETLEQEIKAIAQGPVLTAEAVAERFPFLENTFEQTLDGL